MIYKSRFLDLLLIFVFIYSIFFIFHKFSSGKIPFWDFHVHYCTAKNFLLGIFPYGLNALDNCLNPNITLTANFSPVALEIMKYLGYLNISTAKILWIFLEIISLLTLILILKKLFKPRIDWRYILALFFSFGATIFTSFISGNISVILYGALSLGIYFLYKKFFHFYYIIIIFVSLFKFYYLSFLIIPFYLCGFKSVIKITISLFVFFLIQYFFYLINPELTLSFFDVIQGKYPDNLPVRMQTGTGLYSIIEKIPLVFVGIKSFERSFFSLEINLLIWFFVCSIVLLSTFICLNSNKLKKSNKHFLFCISFGILSIDLIIPRLVVYDLVLTIPVIFYLINHINYKKVKFKYFNFKYILIFLFFILFDHHFPFLVAITFLTTFLYSEFFNKKLFIY